MAAHLHISTLYCFRRRRDTNSKQKDRRGEENKGKNEEKGDEEEEKGGMTKEAAVVSPLRRLVT
jgi:hypothetical protein